MKLTRRQLDQIAGIVAEEKKLRDSLHEGMYNSRKMSLMVEAEGRPDLVSVARNLDQEQITSDIGRDVLTKFDKVMYKRLADVLAQSGGDKKSPATLMDDVEDYDPDLLQQYQQDLVAEISAALVKYAESVALSVEAISLPPEE